MYRDVPANRGTYVTAKEHGQTSCPSSRATLAAELVLRPWLIRVVAMGNVVCSGLF